MSGHFRISGNFKEMLSGHARIGGSWKEVSEGFTRIGGSWKQWFASGFTTFSKVANLAVLGNSRAIISSAPSAFSGRAVFTGGVTGNFSSPQSISDSYDANLVKQSIPSMPEGRFAYPAIQTTEHLVIPGGYWSYNGQTRVDFYRTNFTTGTASALSSGAYGHAGGKAGERAYVAGIGNNNYPYLTNFMDSYNSSMVKSSSTLLAAARGGGFVNGESSVMFHFNSRSSDGNNGTGEFEVWNSSGVRVSNGNTGLSTSGRMQSANTQNYGFIQLQRNDNLIFMSAYNSNFVRSAIANKEDPSITASSAQVANLVMFAGGNNTSNNGVNSVTIYNNDLVKTIGSPLSQGRAEHGIASVEGHVIIAGGSSSGGGYGSKLNSVEAYKAQ